MLYMDRGGRGLSNGRLDGEICGVDRDATPSLAGSIGNFLVHVSSGRCSNRPPMVGMNRGERGLSIGIEITKIGRFNNLRRRNLVSRRFEFHLISPGTGF